MKYRGPEYCTQVQLAEYGASSVFGVTSLRAVAVGDRVVSDGKMSEEELAAYNAELTEAQDGGAAPTEEEVS